MFQSAQKTRLPSPEEALPGRDTPMTVAPTHVVLGTAMRPPYAKEFEIAVFGMGCFWGAERLFWQLDGVYTTAVGYANGYTPNPSYAEVCTSLTGHNEVVQVVFDPQKIEYTRLLAIFWEHHDPTQGMRQGNDIGTQYRSAIYTTIKAHHEQAQLAKIHYQQRLEECGYGKKITTEIVHDVPFYFAEDYHQQYLAKNPDGYCGLAGLGVSFQG